MTDFTLKNTIARKFLDDPRLEQAKKLIGDVILDHQKHITKISHGAPDQSENYQQMIQELSQNRGGNLFYRYIGSGFGNGPFVELVDGSVKYDFITGIWLLS